MPAVAVDTHAIVWYLANDIRLSSKAADALDLATEAGDPIQSLDLPGRINVPC